MTNRVYPLEIRGFAHSSVDALHPLPERPEESLPLSYIETVRNGNFTNFTPDTSGRSSPTTDNTLSLANGLFESNTWSTNTGILTGRSSVYSWGNEDEFDRQASATVKHMFDEIDGMLFEGKHFNGSSQLLSECEEWFKRFPHLRICGFQMLNSKDDGTQLIPFPAGDPGVFSQRPQTSVLEDVEEFGAFDSQGLCIKGFHLDPLQEPPESYMNDEMNGYYTEFEEEVLAEDGEVVEYFGYDQPALEEEGTDSSTGFKYRRQQRRGYPPVTPNACAKDAVVSQLFDQAWGEVVLWLRDLLSLYSQKVLRDKPQFLADVVVSSDRVIESPLRPFSQSVMSRNIFSSQTRLKPFPSFNPPLDPNSLISAMKVQTVRLNPRAPSASTSHALDSRDTETPYTQGRPASSRSVNSQFTRGIGGHSSESFIFKNTPFRKNRNLPSLPRSNHLESSKPKTPSTQDDVMRGIVQGRKLFTEKERLSSPPQAHANSPAPNMGRIVLPPIDGSSFRETPVHQNGGRHSAKQVSFRPSRASSAATDDSRQSYKDRSRNFVEPRPSTTAATHSLRTDITGRRMSTPMGTYTASLGMYPRGQTRHSHGQSPLTGITGVSMSISSHPATEANASSYSHQFDGRGISPVSDEEYDGFNSPGPSNQPSQRKNKLVTTSIR
ncbi:protein FAM149A-like isoform X2 [Oculina patagonica]